MKVTRPYLLMIAMVLVAAGACDSDNGGAASETTGSTQPSEETTVDTDALAGELSTEYQSSDSQLRLTYPTAWRIDETFSGAALVLANTTEAMERYSAGQSPAPGDFVVNVGLLPFALLQQRELRRYDVQLEASPDVFLESVLPIFHTTGNSTLGAVELVALDAEHSAGQVSLTANDREGWVLAAPAGERVAALISTVAYPGEMESFAEVAYRIAASIIFEGDGDALYGTLLTS